MGIFDKLKFSAKGGSASGGKKDADRKKVKEENVLEMVKEESPAKSVEAKPLKESTGQAFAILLRSKLTEKTNLLAGLGKYVFVIHPKANKSEVKKAVEKVYDVHVRQVNIVRVKGKSRRYGPTQGETKKWKKAIVTLAPGEKIEGLTQTV